MGPAPCPIGPDWVTCPFLGLALTGIPWQGRQTSAHWLRQSDPNPQLPADRGGWGVDWEPGALLQGLYTDLCPSWGHALEQSSTQCKALSSVFTMSLWNHPLRRVNISSASTFPLGPCNLIPWPLLHALAIPGSEISRVLLRKYTWTVKEGGTHRQTLESWEVVKNRGDLVGMGP